MISAALVVTVLIVLASIVAFVAHLVWVRELEVRSDGDAVIEHLRHAPLKDPGRRDKDARP